VATEDRVRGDQRWEGRSVRLQEAQTLLAGLRDRLFGGGQPAHFDLLAWMDRVATMTTRDSAAVKLPEPNFVTIE
jgi:hypothetical protein